MTTQKQIEKIYISYYAEEKKMMPNKNEKIEARSEAAIYAEGTPFRAEELYLAWLDQADSPEADDCQRVYERVLREHPDFVLAWLE